MRRECVWRVVFVVGLLFGGILAQTDTTSMEVIHPAPNSVLSSTFQLVVIGGFVPVDYTVPESQSVLLLINGREGARLADLRSKVGLSTAYLGRW